MKNIFKIFSLGVIFAGIVNISYAQRTRQLRGEGNTRPSGNVSRTPSAPRQMETRSAPVRSFNDRGSAQRVQSPQSSRQMTVRQAPERNFNNNRVAQTREFQNSSNNQRVFSQRNPSSSDQRIVASRNNDNRYERDRVSRNVYQNNYRGYDRDNRYYNHYDRDDRYYGNVYGRRTRFMFGARYTVIPHNFISIHFGGYPYYYYGGYYYGYYNGYYQPIFPPFGLHISVLPFGYVRLFIGGLPYYYYNGIYYRQYDNTYEVVDAPMGATVSSLPEGARSVIINGESLYELNGTYYKADRDENGNDVFIVVGKNGVINNTSSDQSNIITAPESMQVGDIVTQLPENSKIVTVNGEQLYQTPDNIYLREESNNGIVQYRVVGK